MIKRIVALLLLLAFCLALASCGEKEKWDQALSDEENRTFTLSNGAAQINGSILYFKEKRTRLLRYLDLETGESMILCARPECMHEDKNCDAYLSGLSTRIMIWNGRLYDIENNGQGFVLYSRKLDGSDIRLEKKLEGSCYNGVYARIYEGRLYTCNTINAVQDGRPIYDVYVYSEPIDSAGPPEVIYQGEGMGLQTYGAIENGVFYFAVQHGAPDTEDPVDLYAYDIASGSLELLHSWESPLSYWSFMVSDEALHVGGFGRLSSYNLKDGSFSEFTDMEKLASDSPVFACRDYFVSPALGSIAFISYSGDVIYKGELKNDEFDFLMNSQSAYGTYKDKFIYYMSWRAEEGSDSIALVDVNTGELEVIWQSEPQKY